MNILNSKNIEFQDNVSFSALPTIESLEADCLAAEAKITQAELALYNIHAYSPDMLAYHFSLRVMSAEKVVRIAKKAHKILVEKIKLAKSFSVAPTVEVDESA